VTKTRFIVPPQKSEVIKTISQLRSCPSREFCARIQLGISVLFSFDPLSVRLR
jgi:hypothetical protein